MIDPHPGDPFGVKRVIVLVGAAPGNRRQRWKRLRNRADFSRGVINGVGVLAVFDYHPSMDVAHQTARAVGATYWMLVNVMLTDSDRVYVEQLGGERPEPVIYQGEP